MLEYNLTPTATNLEFIEKWAAKATLHRSLALRARSISKVSSKFMSSFCVKGKI